MNWVEKAYLGMEFRNIISIILLVLMLATLSLVVYTMLRRTLRRYVGKEILRKMHVHGEGVVFPEQVKLVKGIIGLVAVKGLGTNVVLKVDITRIGNPEDRLALTATDICWRPPTVRVFFGKEVYADLPGYVVLNGTYRGLIVTCIDTGLIKSRADIEVLDKYGYFKGYYRAEKGIVKAMLNWVQTQSTIPVNGKVVMEICVKGYHVKGCTEVAELSEPGTTTVEHNYMIYRKILVGNLLGEGLEEVAELANIPLGLIAMPGAIVRLGFKTSIRKRTIKETLLI